MSKIKKIKLSPAKCAVDLSDGSERGLYVNQDYILQKLHRPHRAINLMYCYYPLDKGWPARASEAFPDMEIHGAWDYPYDNYFPYLGGLNGSQEGEPFTCMREVRRHGQDVILTLTCDPHVTDEHIIAIAKDLRKFGRMMLRVNHEASGNWFSFNKRASHEEVGDFFVRFHKIVKEYAPNVSVILCLDGVKDLAEGKLEKEEAFIGAVRATDIWSVDRYLALNWGYPFEVAEKDNFGHGRYKVSDVYKMAKESYKRYQEICDGAKKPMVLSELNADGDVTGPFDQVKMMQEFCDMLKKDEDHWLDGFTFYQFRDDGRLGLEITDPNNSDVGIEQPMLAAYRDIIKDDFFKPGMEEICDIEEGCGTKEGCDVGEACDRTGAPGLAKPVILRWGGAEDAEGISMELEMEKSPVFAEANFKGALKDANLMMEINGRWFYKAPGVEFIDFMPAFFSQDMTEPCTVKLNIFAPPATGENDPSQGEDWQENYYYTLTDLPQIRLRFAPIM